MAAHALNYDKGGRMDLPQSGGALGGCANHRPAPAPGDPQRHFSGSGVPPKSGLDACHLMLGAPGDTLAALHQHVLDLAKPIAMLKNARTGAGLRQAPIIKLPIPDGEPMSTRGFKG